MKFSNSNVILRFVTMSTGVMKMSSRQKMPYVGFAHKIINYNFVYIKFRTVLATPVT
jgi:hypothetical protein